MTLQPSGEVDITLKRFRFFRRGHKGQLCHNMYCAKDCEHHKSLRSPQHLLRFGSMFERTFLHSGGRLSTLEFHCSFSKESSANEHMLPSARVLFPVDQREWKCSTSWRGLFLPTGSTSLITVNSTITWIRLLPSEQFQERKSLLQSQIRAGTSFLWSWNCTACFQIAGVGIQALACLPKGTDTSDGGNPWGEWQTRGNPGRRSKKNSSCH